ncbi:hypothetical protein OUZ56_003373 [Daphnia magna]|uniref:Uncharacterized protein n=1 Tax=Daphnia magna TaxID=35525 RepID=A0ABR0A8N7_9CRUS|nr:hypothetical protein OUZ56_003373 [Daphnia magna]
MTESRSIKTRAAVAAEVSDDRFALQEVALDEAKSNIANLNGWVERVDAKFTKESQRLGQEAQTVAVRQDGTIAALDAKGRMLETEVRRIELQLQQRQSAMVEGGLKRIREEMDARETSIVATLQNMIRDETTKAMKNARTISLLS